MKFGDSWSVETGFVAVKELDATCFDGRETGIPKGMKWFFQLRHWFMVKKNNSIDY